MIDSAISWFEASNPTSILIVGLVICVIAGVGFLFNGRRAFYRRNKAGNEEFSSFGTMLLTRMLEWIVYAASLAVLLVGSILVVVGIGGVFS